MWGLALRALASGRVGEELAFFCPFSFNSELSSLSVDQIALVPPFTLREVDSTFTYYLYLIRIGAECQSYKGTLQIKPLASTFF